MTGIALFLLFLTVSIVSGRRQVRQLRDVAEEVSSAMDKTVNPCDDFYTFACGGWIKNTTLPPTKSRMSKSFTTVQDNNEIILRSIVNDPSTGKVHKYFKACMNLTYIDSLGYQPIREDLQYNPRDISELYEDMATLFKKGVRTFFSFSAQMDPMDPAMVRGQLDQGGLGLPYPSLYLENSTHASNIRQAYLKHITTVFGFVWDKNTATQAAKLAYELEEKIAEFTIPADELFDPFLSYNNLTSDELKAINPEIVNTFFQYLGLGPQPVVIVTVPAFFSNLTAILPKYQLNWRSYLIWQVLRTNSGLLSKEFRDEAFNFYGNILGGQSKPSPRDKQCITSVDGAIGELLGYYFVEKAFPEQSRKSAVDLLDGIINAMKNDITSLSWMDKVTRARALTKLSLITDFIGSPEDYDTYDSVLVTDNFHNNYRNAVIYSIERMLSFVGQTSNMTLKSQWEMTAPTVNAYYEPTKNQMVFPAGILQTPFFDYSYPVEMQIGAIGMVMGHELTHGFDSQGRLYDGTGKLINWWEPATSKLFDSKVDCVIQQYSKFEVLPGLFVNGKLTQGENIADMGGVKNAYMLASLFLGVDFNQPSIVPGLSRSQLFFVSAAQVWCEVSSEAYLRLRVASDPHSPGKFRVLGPLINLPEFSDIFECPAGSFMNPGPQSTCSVW